MYAGWKYAQCGRAKRARMRAMFQKCTHKITANFARAAGGAEPKSVPLVMFCGFHAISQSLAGMSKHGACVHRLFSVHVSCSVVVVCTAFKNGTACTIAVGSDRSVIACIHTCMS